MIDRPVRAKNQKMMKGRPITGEEFDKMIAAVPKVVAQKIPKENTDQINRVVESWQHYLKGLWWSGLRLTESLELYWDRDQKLKPIMAGKKSLIIIPGNLEKGNESRACPMAPEFFEFLDETPEVERRGPVFRPLGDEGGRVGTYFAGHVISDIGKVAGVIVDHYPDNKPKKYASAHDLRRSFGERWARHLMPAKLRELMRHTSIDTTMRYYVGHNAEDTACVLWAVKDRTDQSNPQNHLHDTKNPTPTDRRNPLPRNK